MNKISITTLGNLIEFQRGYDLPKSSFIEGYVPVISSNGILGFHNEYKVQGPGITIGRSGTVGLPQYIEGNFFPHNTALFIKDFKGNHPKYIYYLLKTLSLNDRGSGSGVPTMNRNHLHPLMVSAHLDFTTQQKIASVLSTLDAKIEVNNRINAELEAMAKTLYDYWFVQFDFPDKNGRPYKTSGGKMVWNEDMKKELPVGWEAKILLNFCSAIGDGIHGTPEYADKSDNRFINGNNLKNGFIDITNDTKSVSSEEYEKYFIELNEGTILLSINGTLGNLAVFTGEKVVLGKSAAYINCKGKNRPYCYQFLKLENIQKKFWNIATGSTIKNLSLDSLKNLIIPFPGDDLVEHYFVIANPLEEKKKNIFRENQQLASLRDWLLPMLMNGQVKVV